MLVKFDLEAEPKVTGCGLLWEHYRSNSMDHAFCCMPWPMTPHYHKRMVETYCITAGKALVVIGDERFEAEVGMTFEILPITAHYVIPHRGEALEMTVSNAPAFNSFAQPDFFELNRSHEAVGFNQGSWRRDLEVELAWRNIKVPEGDESALVEALCLPTYLNQFQAALK